MSNPSPLLRVEHVSLTFGRGDTAVPVLQGISFELERGEIVAIVGPSGCGKSTLLKVLAGVQFPTTGIVQHGGYTATAELPRISVVPQGSSLLPWLTAKQNIQICLDIAGDAESTALEYIERVGLTGFEAFLPRNLSGGMQGRVSVARGLAVARDLILLDEAFGDLDEVTRQLLNDVVRDQIEVRSLGAVIVSHDIQEAVYLSDRILVLSHRPSRVLREFIIDLPRSSAGFSVVSLLAP